MTGWGAIIAAVGVIALSAAVMVFKQHVDAEERRLDQLQRDLAAAEVMTGQLTAELAYHQRPAYLAGFAGSLGLAPATPQQLTSLARLPARPDPALALALVALPSGGHVTIRRRPEPLQMVGLQ